MKLKHNKIFFIIIIFLIDLMIQKLYSLKIESKIESEIPHLGEIIIIISLNGSFSRQLEAK